MADTTSDATAAHRSADAPRLGDASPATSEAPHGGCAGGVALAPGQSAETSAPVVTPFAPPAPAVALLAVPPVALGLTAPAFQMLGSDDVGVCVDGVCAIPTPPTSV